VTFRSSLDSQRVIQKENFVEKQLFGIKFNIKDELENKEVDNLIRTHEGSQDLTSLATPKQL
jgi:hypothetical protein